jgi:hypothetical protein
MLEPTNMRELDLLAFGGAISSNRYLETLDS